MHPQGVSAVRYLVRRDHMTFFFTIDGKAGHARGVLLALVERYGSR